MKASSTYESLAGISSQELQDKSVLLVGAGWMATQYAFAFSKMGIKDVTILSKNEHNVSKLCDESGFRPLAGGYEKRLPTVETKDLLVIATPIHLLLPAAKAAIKSGQQNVLIEKPGSLYHKELVSLLRTLRKQRVRVGYNRLLYPNLHKLKQLVRAEGGISSCRFTFTEWTHTIDFDKERRDAYRRWGISNSLHVIAMAFELIGMPTKLFAQRHGDLKWHPTGSVFVGSGMSENHVPFSYHADWKSAGRWGIEVMTEENAYKLVPLEELHVCKRGTTDWQRVPYERAFPEVKPGLAEQVVAMLDRKIEAVTGLVSLKKAASLNKVAEKIFGYK